jgi:ABC-type multidrug transport system ATPase subunit
MRLNDVAFRYARRGPWILRDVTLELEPRRIIEFSGANGAGKSTLLRIVAGIMRPRRGAVGGRPVRVGYAPERFPADQPFTIAAYLGFMARMRGLSETAIRPWTERLALTPLLDVPLPELSKGSAQKVGLVQALFPRPELLVLDEPFAGLDTETRADLPGLLSELAADGTTVVVSDHQRCLDDLDEVDRFRVADNTVRRSTRDEQAAGDGEPVVLEVVVAADEADAVTAKLRADGYDVRRPR